MAGRFHLVLDNRLDELDRLAAWLEHLGTRNGWPGDTYLELRTAVYEAVANVIFYAFGDGERHQILVDVEADEDHRLAVHIEDDGIAFDPTAAPAPEQPGSLADAAITGRGIVLMRGLSDDVSYERRQGRNRLTLTRRLF